MRIKERLQHIIKNSLLELNIQKKTSEIIIESSKEIKNGDYYTNIAISLTKELHKKPEEIAEILKDKINDEIIKKIEITYPGTINIYINKNCMLNGLSEIISKNINYGKSNIGSSRKINIDYINIDFVKTLNNKELFNAIYCDNLSRILKYNGFEITKEYYFNDTSKEIEQQANISKERYINLCKSSNNIEIKYSDYDRVRDTAYDIYSLYRNRKENEDIDYFKKEEISSLFDKRKKELDNYRINYNVYTSEQSLYDKGLIDKILDKLNKSGNTYFNNDELWLKTTNFNDTKDRILINSDGTYNSLLPQIAYFVDKVSKNYDGIISVYNKEYEVYKNVIKPILNMLGEDTTKIAIKVLPTIKVEENDNQLKEETINNLRYIFSNQNINDSVININLNSNKFDIIEQTNIKIHNIFRNYNKKITKVNNYSTIDSELAYTILNKLYEFEEIVITAGLKQIPHLICDYLYQLSKVFNEYYNNEKIITDDEIYTNERLNLLLAVKIVLNNGLDLIGIIPKEEK